MRFGKGLSHRVTDVLAVFCCCQVSARRSGAALWNPSGLPMGARHHGRANEELPSAQRKISSHVVLGPVSAICTSRAV